MGEVTNDSVFMNRHCDHNKLTHSSGEGAMFNFSFRSKSLPICIGHNKICVPIRRQIWAYVLLDTRTINHMGLFSSYFLSF